MKKIVITAAAGVLTLMAAASNSYAFDSGAIGGLLGAALRSGANPSEPEPVEAPTRMAVNPGSQGVYRGNRGVNPGSQGVYRGNQGVNPGSQGVNRGTQGSTTPACRYGTYTLHGSVYCKP